MAIASPDAFEVLKQPGIRTVTYKQINGDFETNSTGWSANNAATISRDTTQAKHGTTSLKVVTNGTTTNEGAYYNSGISSTGSGIVYWSIWVYHAAGGATMWLFTNGVSRLFTTVAGWNYVICARPPGTGTATFDMFLRTQTTAQAITFYLDELQLELEAPSILQPTVPWVDTSAGDQTRSYPSGHPSPIL